MANQVKLPENVLLMPASSFWQSSLSCWRPGHPTASQASPWILFQSLLVLGRWPHQRLLFHGALWFSLQRENSRHWPIDTISRNGTTSLCPDLKPVSSFQPLKSWAKLIWTTDQWYEYRCQLAHLLQYLKKTKAPNKRQGKKLFRHWDGGRPYQNSIVRWKLV